MHILQPLPLEKWPALRDSMKRDWPTYAYYYNYVKNSIKWKSKDPSIEIEFYCPEAKVESGVFIRKCDPGQVALFLFSFGESKDRINCGETFNCACIHESIADVLKGFLDGEAKGKGLQNYTSLDNYCYFKSKEDCLKIEVEIPEECKLSRIDESVAPLLHSVSPHRNVKNPEKTLKCITAIAKLNGGYGLFMKRNGRLVSWIMQCQIGGLGILQTVEEHQQKGYGKAVARAQAKYLAETEDIDVTAHVASSNRPSQRLFESMGFERVASSVWFYINP